MSNLLRKPEVLKKTGLSTSVLYARMSAGTFPKPVRLGPKMVAWVEAEVNDWCEERIAERDAEPPKVSGQRTEARGVN